MNEPNPLRPERSLDLTRPAALARVAPALVLLVLSPIVAEFLLGDFSVRQIGLLFAFIPQYGGGALLVRESARRAGKGWPSIILLALAYALIEEGFTTQSLFNPNYAGERLLDYGFIPAFGTSLNWAVFVLTIHVVWSIGSCIVIAEALAAERWSTPWLGRLGYTLTALLFLSGCVLTARFTVRTFPYVASAGQFAAVAILVVVAITVALRWRGVAPVKADQAPSVWITGLASLALGSAVLLLAEYAPRSLPAPVSLGLLVALDALALALIALWSRREGWGPRHALALATGAIVTYGWLSIARMIVGRTTLGAPTTALDVVGQVALLLLVLLVIRSGARRIARASPGRPRIANAMMTMGRC